MSTVFDNPDWTAPAATGSALVATLAEITDPAGVQSTTIPMPPGAGRVSWDSLVGDANNALVFSITGAVTGTVYFTYSGGAPTPRQQGQAALDPRDTTLQVKFSTPSAAHPLILFLYALGSFTNVMQAAATLYSDVGFVTPANGSFGAGLGPNGARKGLFIHNLGAAALGISFNGVNEHDLIGPAPSTAWTMAPPVYTGTLYLAGASGGAGLAVRMVEIS